MNKKKNGTNVMKKLSMVKVMVILETNMLSQHTHHKIKVMQSSANQLIYLDICMQAGIQSLVGRQGIVCTKTCPQPYFGEAF